MSVNNYTINKCQYSIDKLDKVIYLIEKSSLGNVDTQSYYIDGGAQATMIRCNSLSLSETTSLNERYKFTHTINCQVDGYKTVDDLNGRFHVVVKDMNGVYYVVNPEFKMKVSYTFTLDSVGSYTDFTFSTVSDYPLMRVDNFAPWASADSVATDGSIYKWVNITPTSSNTTYICDVPSTAETTWECKDYSLCGINNIKLNETAYSTYENGFAHYTNDGFKTIDYLKNSASFTENFDGNKVIHTLKFTLPYSDSSWHNSLLDFNDNKYCTIITTKCGKSIACGFQHGLMPSYNITGSNSETNKVEITLSDLHDQGQLIIVNDLIDTSGQTATTWQWVNEYYECVDNNTAKHLLMEEYDIYGNPLDLYKCLEGYRIDFEWLAAEGKLVGEFEETQSIYFPNYGACHDTECSLTTTLGDMTFNDTSTKHFTISCNHSNWAMISSSNDISFSPISGEAGVEYTLAVTNGITPTSSAQTETLTVYFCDAQYSVQYNVTIEEKPVEEIFPQGDTYHVNTLSQTLNIPTTACIQGVTSNKSFVHFVQAQNGYITLQIEGSIECSARTATLTVTLCDNSTATLYVIQDGNDCSSPMLTCEYSDGSTYTVPCTQNKTIDSSHTTASTAPLASTMSSCTIGNCATKINAYAFTYCTNLQTVTIGSGITSIDYKAFDSCTALTNVTVNATTPPEIGVSIFNNNLQHIYVDCAYVTAYKAAWSDYASKIEAISGTCPEYNRTTSGTPYCQGFDKYVDVYFQVSNDGGATWTTISTTPTLLETNSAFCEYVPPQPIDYNTQPFTLVAVETSTFKFNASTIANLPAMQYSIDSGNTWTIMTESTTPIVQAGNKIMFKGTCTPSSFFGIGRFESSGKLNVEGNIMSLMYGNNFTGQTSLSGKDCAFINLFSKVSNLINAENLILPATTLSYMCYSGMFNGCTKLEKAPVLSAATLVNACYMSLFQECSSLNSITCLATNISAENCTTSWVKNVAASGTFTKAASMSSWTSGNNGIPNNWTIENYS